jgi:imidazole glycerol-phosphate synthase subunit HisF
MSLSIRIIPCLDVADGRVVKGVNFENLRDAGDPIELSAYYYESGADELTFLDVNATNENRSTMYDLVRRTAEQVFIPLTVGGGVRSVDDVDRLLQSGADKVSIASAALNDPSVIEAIANRFGSQVLVLSLDAKRDSNGAFVATKNGGRVVTDIDALSWVKRAIDLGVGEVLLNSIDADGTQAGFDIEMLEKVRAVSSVPLIASGGAGKAQDFVAAAQAGADAILAASIFHNRSVTIQEVKKDLAQAGFEVR